MSGPARNLEQEFWRPPERSPQPMAAAGQAPLLVCPRCSAGQPGGARFCPSCGHPREVQLAAQAAAPPFRDALAHVRQALGLGNAALVAFAVGLLFVVVAILLSSF